MAFRKLRRSIRCHLKHGNRCPHIERHALRRPRTGKRHQKRVKARTQSASPMALGRHAASGR